MVGISHPTSIQDFSGKVSLNLAFGLVTSCCSHLTCMLLRGGVDGGRVHEHWFPQIKPLGWEWEVKKALVRTRGPSG